MSELAILHEVITITVGALASQTAVLGSSKIDASRENGFRIMKTEYEIDYRGKTASEGPVEIGFAYNQSATLIGETLADDPQSRVEDENAGETKRPVYPLEMVPYNVTNKHGTNPTVPTALRSMTARWSIPEGNKFDAYAYNWGGGALTTGMTITIRCKHYGVWLRD